MFYLKQQRQNILQSMMNGASLSSVSSCCSAIASKQVDVAD